MTHLLPTVVALAISMALIVVLASGDPKRRRSARLAGEGQSQAVRLGLAALACLPGMALGLLGDAAGLLLWLGGAAVAGWMIALLFAETGQEIR